MNKSFYRKLTILFMSVLVVSYIANACYGPSIHAAEILVPHGFTATTFATGLHPRVTDIAVRPDGSSGTDLYVAEVEYVAPQLYGRISKVSPNGTVNTFTTGVSRPFNIAFGPGGNFGADLYVAETYPEAKILKISPSGSITTFVAGEFCYGLAFSLNGGFGEYLFTTEPAPSFTGKIVKIDSGGMVSSFVDGLITISSDLVFSTGGDFGNNIYVGQPGASSVYLVNSLGIASRFAWDPLLANSHDLAFGTGCRSDLYVGDYGVEGQPGSGRIIKISGVFSSNLFVAEFNDGNIIEVDSEGHVNVFASGFNNASCLVFVTPSCQGDFDNDGDVDGSDLAVFATEFGRTDCSAAQTRP